MTEEAKRALFGSTVDRRPKCEERLSRVIDACPEASAALESDRWSRAAFGAEERTIWEPSSFDGPMPFDPAMYGVVIAFRYDDRAEQYVLAWVAVYPLDPQD